MAKAIIELNNRILLNAFECVEQPMAALDTAPQGARVRFSGPAALRQRLVPEVMIAHLRNGSG